MAAVLTAVTIAAALGFGFGTADKGLKLPLDTTTMINNLNLDLADARGGGVYNAAVKEQYKS